MRRGGRCLGYHVLALLLAGCAAGPSVKRMMYRPADLSLLLQERLGEAAQGVTIPYETNEEMLAFARKTVALHDSLRSRIDALSNSMASLSAAGLGIRYDAGAVLSAREVWEKRRANCISSTNLFVAMARSVGIEAYYAHVTERRRYIRRAGTIVHIGHICAAVRDGSQVLLVDFAQEGRKEYLGYKLLDDMEALAHFVVNQGMDYGSLLGAPADSDIRLSFTDADVARLELALRIKPGFPQGLLNLGTANLLRGKQDVAEQYYRDAIASDKSFGPAYAALASLLYSQQRAKEALDLYEEAAEHQRDNPYVHYHLALTNFTMKRYEEAERSARHALRWEPTLADAHLLLGIIAQIGREPTEARQRFERALELDPQLEDARIRLWHVNEELGANRPGETAADPWPVKPME